jgi:FKBP-type peptidyl-prolyl cis-trans isomerase
MRSLNKKEWIAVWVGLAFIASMFYGASFMNLFGFGTNEEVSQGVQVRDVVAGSGRGARVGDRLTVHYIGTLINGEIFDSSLERGTPFPFVLGAGEVIRGWDEGLVGLRVGGRRQLIIPPDYAYGQNVVGPIPANSTLIFEVELLGFDEENGVN